ncbi:hypothetical protein D023_4490B, partial [Vibrio parahaemolyticus 3256]
KALAPHVSCCSTPACAWQMSDAIYVG